MVTRLEFHGWIISYSTELCLFEGDGVLLITSVYQRAVLGQLCYCPQTDSLRAKLAEPELELVVKSREVQLIPCKPWPNVLQ